MRMSWIALLFAPMVAHAEVWDGSANIYRASNNTVIGSALMTGNSPLSGYSAHRAYWQWDVAAPPSFDFYLATGTWTGSTGSVKYVSQEFPASATEQLPTSIGQDDGFYKIWVCSTGLTSCTWVGGLWAEDDTGTLHWYMRDSYDGDVFSWASSQVLLFDYLATLPSTSEQFRYLEEAPL